MYQAYYICKIWLELLTLKINIIETQKNFFQQMLNAIPDLIFYKDTFSTYLGCNKAFAEKFLGLKEEEIVGKTDLELVKDEQIARFFRQKDAEMLEAGETRINEETIRMANDTIMDVETLKTPFYDESGKIIGLIGISRDISLRKEMELELIRAKEQAEVANVMKSQFLANMSHEIRTPMNGVLGYLDLLSRTTLSSEQKEYIREARVASDILLYLINDILDFSKIEAGKLKMEKIPFSLRTTIEDAILLSIPKASEKHIELHTIIKSNVPEKIEGDPARLRQIISNLVGNAVKFTESGEITVQVDTRTEAKEQVTIKFQIRDTGIGISKEDINKLFKPFMQADASTTRKHGGTGLGLAISSQLVKMMGGSINVESTPGMGSTFNFSINAKVIQKNPGLEYGFNKLEGANILIVDDNENSRKILRAYLEEAGCTVVDVDSSDKALTTLILNASTQNKIAVAIVYFQMPGMNGYELATALKTIPYAKAVKLVLLTSAAQRGDAAEAMSRGFEGHISKPVRRDELMNCISLVLGLKEEEQKESPLITRFTVKETVNDLKPKILLVEDNEMNRKIVIKMLKYKNMTCDIAVDGSEALKAVTEKDYDIVFMDCQMPVMDGYESTAKIREFEGNRKHTVIIAMTANAMEGDRTKCIEAGMDDYISKPINYDEMFRTMEANLKSGYQAKEHFDLIDDNIDNFVKITGFTEEDAQGLFVDYIKYLPNIIEDINKAICNNDFDKIAELAHQLKGSSGTLRINSIYELTMALESSALNKEIERCESLLMEIQKLLH